MNPNRNGLGLSISRQIARMMGGDLMCGSQLGTGSVFCLYGKAQISNIDEIRLQLNVEKKRERSRLATP
jgi:signal transduction histidine kinase